MRLSAVANYRAVCQVASGERGYAGFGAVARSSALIVLTITFLSGVDLFSLGAIGEHLGRAYEQVKVRPPNVVGQVVRRTPSPAE